MKLRGSSLEVPSPSPVVGEGAARRGLGFRASECNYRWDIPLKTCTWVLL